MYDRQSIYLTWGGVIGTTASPIDVWQCGVKFAPISAGAPAPSPRIFDQVVNAIGLRLADYHGAASSLINSGAILTHVKIAQLGLDGRYVVDPLEWTTPVTPGGGGSLGAPQLAMVVSLRSGSTLGKANYGRFYLPWTAVNLSSITAKLTVAQREALLADSVDMLTDIQGNLRGAGGLAADLRASIMSNEGSGVTKLVEAVRVGDVVDTQRRRRNKIPETYSVAAFPA